MRIKEEIERSGRFWLPSTPEKEIDGILTISDGGRIKLELTQPLNTDMESIFKPTEGLQQIIGHVDKDGPILIDECYSQEMRRNFTHGRLMGGDVILANRLLTKFPYNENPNLLFNTYSFSVEGIEEWVGINGITFEPESEENALTISYNRPSNTIIELSNGMQLNITFGYNWRNLPKVRKVEITQKTYFILVSDDGCELDEFVSVAKKIAGFLCFVMNELVSIDQMSTTSERLLQAIDDGSTHPITVGVYCPTWAYDINEPEINELDMLFKFADYQQRFESMINLWIENYNEISPALDLYFQTKTGKVPSLNMQFLTLVQGLEALHTQTSVDIGLRNWITQLTDLFEKYMGGDNRPMMIDKIIDTRNYLTHHNPKLKEKSAKGQVLMFLCNKMNVLFRLQFLKLIGFSIQEIDDIVDNCSYFKGECNR